MMFKKILVAEDFDTINIAVAKTLEELSVPAVDHAKYCDDALLKVKRAMQVNEPFDLLITDLSFPEDGRGAKIRSGEELIEKVREIQPGLDIIVFSVEDRPFRVSSLFEKHRISGFVFKGRSSLSQLKQALQSIADGSTYLSPELSASRPGKQLGEIDDYDIALLKLMARGMTQGEIAQHFRETGVTPNSTSAVEKKINKLKIQFMANNSIQIVVMAKDLGFI